MKTLKQLERDTAKFAEDDTDWLKFIAATIIYSTMLGLIIVNLPTLKEWIS